MKTDFLVLVATMLVAPLVVKGAPTTAGKFQISDNGVHGEGTYQIMNDTVEIGLRLVIGAVPASEINKTADLAQSGPVEEQTSSPHGLSDEESTFMQEVLLEHNKYRSIHGSSPMKLSTQMSMESFAFAKQLAQNGSLVHSIVTSRPNQGENLAMGCSTDGPGITSLGVVKRWYDEVCKHNFANKDFQKPSGHFINIVWKPTEELGIAMAHGTKWGMNCTWVVARYRPRVQYRPEVENSFGLNVEKGTFDPAYCNANGEEQQEKGNERSWRNRVNWGRPYAGYGFRTKIPRTPRVMVA